jgi:hypothetical protein
MFAFKNYAKSHKLLIKLYIFLCKMSCADTPALSNQRKMNSLRQNEAGAVRGTSLTVKALCFERASIRSIPPTPA